MLSPVRIDFATAWQELGSLREWLKERAWFTERDVVQELRARPSLACLLGYLEPGMRRPDRYRFELAIQGVFRADLVVGSAEQGKFVLVEFEGAERNSLFGPRHTHQIRDWGRQLERGISQAVDWSWAKNDVQHTSVYKNAFACERVSELYVVVCGRDASMDAIERSRFEWRAGRTSIGGSRILCLTYDDLLAFLQGKRDQLREMRDGL
jgi:hypothetical protein